MSERAIAYVRERNLVDPDAARVLLLLAGRTDALPIEDPWSPMRLLLSDCDIPAVAATLNLGADRFREPGDTQGSIRLRCDIPDEAFARYGAGQELIAEVKAWALNWSTEIGLDIAESEPWSDEENY